MNWKMNQKRWAWILSGVAAAPLGIAISLAGMHNLIGEAAQPPTDASAGAPGGGGGPAGGFGSAAGGGLGGGDVGGSGGAQPFGSAAVGGLGGGDGFGGQGPATGLPGGRGGLGTTDRQQDPNPPARQTAPRASRNRGGAAQSPNSGPGMGASMPTLSGLPPAAETTNLAYTVPPMYPSSPNQFPNTPLAYNGQSYRYVQPDPKDLEYQQETQQLLQQYRTKANDSEEKQTIKNELSEVLHEQFDHRIANREKELADLKKQVEELEQLIGQRKKNRKEIVERRLLEITGGHDPMSWDSTNSYGPSPLYNNPAHIVRPPAPNGLLLPASPPENPSY